MIVMQISFEIPASFTLQKLADNLLRTARATNHDAKLTSITILPTYSADRLEIVGKFTTAFDGPASIRDVS